MKKGDEFVIVAKVNNTAAKQQKLVGIDIADTYLEGIAILRTEPNHKEAVHAPLGDAMSYKFDLPVGAGEQKLIKFYVKAVKQGDYNSEIDFWGKLRLGLFQQIHSDYCGMNFRCVVFTTHLSGKLNSFDFIKSIFREIQTFAIIPIFGAAFLSVGSFLLFRFLPLEEYSGAGFLVLQKLAQFVVA